ncbi:MAG: flagellar biosynthetic protein FliO [Planctomycetota bacterium]
MPGMDQMVSTLLGVLILGSVGLVIFARLRKPKSSGTSTLVSHRQSLRITPKHHVHVLEFDNQLFLIGTCESSVNVLKVSDSPDGNVDEMEIAQREDDEDEGAVPKDLIIPRPPARQAKPKPSLDVAQFKKLLAKAKAGQL